MTQTVTGTGLGIQGSSIGLGTYGPKEVSGLGQGGESVYLNAANGNLIVRQSDGFLADLGFGFDLFQTYNSRGEGGGSWCFNVQSRLELVGTANQEGSYVIRVGEDGHRARFSWDASKKMYRPDEGGTASITWNKTGWTYKDGASKVSFDYDTNGRLNEIRDQDGHCLSFHYTNNQLSSITDKSNQQSITWSFKNGLLQDVTTQSNGEVIHHLHYEYDEHQRLHKVSRDLGNGTTYWTTYDYAGDSNRISDIKQSDGTCLHIEYDAQGRVSSLTDGEGRQTTYTYGQGQTTVTNASKESWTYFYDDKDRLTGVDGPEGYRLRYHYEGAQLSSITQGTQVWHYRYNDAGDCIYSEAPNGQITTRQYDAEHHLLTETQYQNFDGTHHPIHPKTTRYVYDNHGHLTFMIEPDGTVTEHRYNSEGLHTSSRCYLHAAYNTKALGELDTLSQDELINWVSQQKKQEVSLVDYAYDWRGQLFEETHYSQVNTEGQGIDSGATHTRTVYDAAGRLQQKSVRTANGWSTTSYLYDDLGRLTQTTDTQNHKQCIEYDDAHQRIIQTDANGLQTIRIYDRSGLLLSTSLLDATHQYGNTQYQYDDNGRLIAETGRDGLSTYFFYDTQGRLHAKVNTQGQMTEYRYNEEGLLIQTYQYAKRLNTQGWRTAFPDLESIRPLTSAKDDISQTIYNQYNQIAYTINSDGAVIGYTYDAEGHVLSKTAYACRLTQFDSATLLTQDTLNVRTDAKDRTIAYYYDTQGHLQAEINAEGYVTEYRYNRLGLLSETCRYATRKTTALGGDWSTDKPTANARTDIHTYSLYDAQGRKVADLDGEGYLTEYSYDASGLLQKRMAYENKALNTKSINEFTTVDDIRPQAGTNDHYTTYDYNDLGQLIEEKTQGGLITTYAYDEMGNVTLKSQMEARSHALRQQRMRYDALGRIIQQLDELGCAKLTALNLNETDIETIWQKHSIQYTYTRAGLLETKTDALHQTTRYFYNEYQQLSYTVSANGAVVETRYNALNQVESVCKYSAYLKGSFTNMTTEELSARITALKDERFDETATYEYNSIGQVIATYRGTKGMMLSQYTVFGELELTAEVISETRYRVNSYAYDRRGLLTDTIDDVSGINRTRSFHYDAFGWVDKQTDGMTNSITYKNNKRGERINIINAANKLQRITYDAFGRILIETDNAQRDVKKYTYDDTNNSLILTNSFIKTQVTTQFNAFGDKVLLRDANDNETKFHYDERGLLIRVDTPEHSFKEYHYDEVGQLSWQEDAGGHKIGYTYDAQGHLLTKTVDPDGLSITTSYKYDAIGRQLQITEANGCTKQFIYDAQGSLIESRVDAKGLKLVTQFAYDTRGLLLRQTEINPKGADKVTAYEWDNLGRRSATIIDPDGLKLTTRYQYDANDNLICQTDAKQHSTHYMYDANNQCRYQVDARGVVTEHTYDANGNELQIVTYAHRIASLAEYTERNLNAVLIKDDAHDQYQFRAFDDAGRLCWSYDALGYATQYQYDGNDNVIAIYRYTKAASLNALKLGGRPEPAIEGRRSQCYVYNGLNQVRFQCDSSGHITAFDYDTSGQVTSRTQYANRVDLADGTMYTAEYILNHLTADAARDKTTRYAYDQAGRLSMEVSPQGVAKSYRYNELNQVISCTRYATLLPLSKGMSELKSNSRDRTNTFVYDAAGREVYRISAQGQVVERRYDAVGNVLAQVTHQQCVSQNTYSANDIATLLENDTGARSTTYRYDATGRLQDEVNAKQVTTHYDYDANGNVIGKTQADKVTWSYAYDEANQRIESTSPKTKVMGPKGATERTIKTTTEYDSFGNVVCETRDSEGLKQKRLFEYDAMNRRTKTTYPGVAINNASAKASSQRQELTQDLSEEVRYNAFGETIASSDKAGHWKHFAYDAQGQLVYSVDTKGGVTKYDYDAFGRTTTKTLYYSPVILKNTEYTPDAIEKAHRGDPHDRHETYRYDLDDQLIESTRDEVRTYDARTKTYKITQPITQNTYNAFGELIQTATLRHPATEAHAAQWATTTTYYDKDGHQTATVDTEGYVTTYKLTAFGDIQSMTEHAQRTSQWDVERYTTPAEHSKDRTVTFVYDELGQVTSKTIVNVTVSSLDKANGNTLKSEVKGLTTNYSYDALGHLVLTEDARGKKAYCYYDALGQLTAKVGPQTQAGRAATTYSYDGLGNLVETHQWAKGAADASNDEYVLNGASNNDILTHATFNLEGQTLSETNGMSHKIEYSYDANGNLARSFQTLTKSDKKSTAIQDRRYSYDSENHLVQTATFKNDGTSQHNEEVKYNIFGEVTDKGLNGKYTVHVEYDTLGRVWRSNTQGYYQLYIYDAADHVTQIVTSTSGHYEQSGDKGVDLSGTALGELNEYTTDLDKGPWQTQLQFQNNTYDALGHLLVQRKEFMGFDRTKGQSEYEASIAQTQTVDRWGNMLTYTNALGHQTIYDYNALNEVVSQELPEVSFMDEHGVKKRIKPVQYYYYDELGNVIAMKDANGHLATKEYDALGRVITETDSKNASRTKDYDLLNQLVSSTNERRAKITYTYDKANRLTSITNAGAKKGVSQSYTYDEAGQLVQQINGEGDTVSFDYDTLGNQTRRLTHRPHKHDVATVYEYDEAGHKTKEYIEGMQRAQTWVYDDNGRLQKHTDLGNHVTNYEYNSNGLLIHESASQGKDIYYYYQGDGKLVQYADVGRNEIVNYLYDAEGQVASKESSRSGHAKDGWIRETDYYKYDELGRLVTVRRRNPEEVDTRFPDENKELLAIDYDYDQVGNIRHTKVGAHYQSNATSISEDYYLYDENNRMTVNKGVLVNGTIKINSTQGSSLSYDEAGNLTGAKTYEHGYEQDYRYEYTLDNQLYQMKKNKNLLQTKIYDEAGRIKEERSFNDAGNLAQRNIMTYVDGELKTQRTENGGGREISHGSYVQDDAGNVTSWTVTSSGVTQTHTYTYEYWDTYQQKTDDITIHIDGRNNTYGKSVRTYDVNGLLESSVDKNPDPSTPSHTTTYLNSSLDGIRARNDKNGRTGYLTVAGKTIGELVLDKSNKQKLTVYGGFTPAGSQQQASLWQHLFQMNQSFNRAPGDKADGTLPEAPQDNLGTYTLQIGDTMESIALQVYGDSSLWYLIADANGISDRKATAGYDDSLHVGQRLNLPASATGQHHTNATHKVLNANQMIGDTSATTALPAPKPPKPKHRSIWSKVLIAAVAVVATVLTAGVMTVGMAGLGTMFSAGLTALGGGVAGTAIGTTLAVGFTAGFVGSIASQGVANALGMQKGLDMTGALISGLATAATAGVGNALKGVDVLKKITTQLNKHSFANFNLATSAEMMELNAAGQVVNVALRKHQHFDWLNLGVSGVTGGFLGGTTGRDLSEKLNQVDKTGFVRTELQALVGAGAESAVTGARFSATEVVLDNLGNAAGNAVVSGIASPNYMAEYQQTLDDLSIDGLLEDYQTSKQDFNNYRARQLEESSSYAPVQTYGGYNSEYSPMPTEDNYSPISEGFYDKSPFNQITETVGKIWEDYGDSILGFASKALGVRGMESKNEFYEYSSTPGTNAAVLSQSINDFGDDLSVRLSRPMSLIENHEGKYNIDYDVLIVKKPGFAYKDSQIVSHSFYGKGPGSPIDGDASRELQIKSIDALVTASLEMGLNLHDTSHVLAIAHKESGFNPYSAAGTTSASGLGQFVKKTGESYGLDDSNRWKINAQAAALVSHFTDNKALAAKYGLTEAYIYKFHHDGANSNYHHDSEGLRIAHREVVPKIRGFSHAIRKVFY